MPHGLLRDRHASGALAAQERQHPHQENPRRGQFVEFDLHRGAGSGACRHSDIHHGEPLLGLTMAQRCREKSSDRFNPASRTLGHSRRYPRLKPIFPKRVFLLKGANIYRRWPRFHMSVLHLEALFAIALSLSILMALAWVVQQRTGNSGWVDTIWTFSVGLVGAGSALWPIAGIAPNTRQWLVAVPVAIWSL